MEQFKAFVFIENYVKEFYSGNSNGESFIRFEGSEIGQKKEIVVPIDCSEGKWIGQSNEDVQFFSEKQEQIAGFELTSGLFFRLQIKDYAKNLHLLILKADSRYIRFSPYYVPFGSEITIGRSEDNSICFKNPLTSKLHVRIKVDTTGDATLYDVSSSGRVFLNGVMINKEVKIAYGDEIFVFGLKLIFMEGFFLLNNPDEKVSCSNPRMDERLIPETAKSLRSEIEGFTKSPRISKYIEKTAFEIDPPPSPQQMKRQPLIFLIGPSMTMGVAMLASLGITVYNAISSNGNKSSIATSGVMAFSMLIGALLWPLLMDRYQKKISKEDELLRVQQYQKYINEQEQLIETRVEEERLTLQKQYPSPHKIVERAVEKNRKLWERTYQDDDFLHVRVGIGTQKFKTDILIQKERFTLIEDELKDEPKRLSEKFARIDDVPITIPLMEDGIIGIIGDYEKRYEMAMCMALQISGMHSYDEVKLVFIYNETQSEKFEWVRGLRHIWSNDRSIRFLATNKEESHEILNYLGEQLREREEKKRETDETFMLPYYVVFVADKELIENEAAYSYLINSKNQVGVSGVFISNRLETLPSDCQTIIQNDHQQCSIYSKKRKEEGQLDFQADDVAEDELRLFTEASAKLELKLQGGSQTIPSSLTFLDMFRAGNLEQLNITQRWNESQPHKSLTAPIGLKAGGELFDLNIHEKYHGPHGLIAGMTGSGKSEFIQTFILSMAVNYHPHDVSFILIDYKGGGMANCFTGLPHIAGVITNLSGNQIRRSLISIDAELRRRQKLFEAANVKHIDEYQLLYKENKIKGLKSNGNTPVPLPHLVIVSDEFAELKQQQPEFMEKLVSAARIGRSLGVHLILATQKPAGVVNDQIWGNTRFRVCLKVLDRSDSQEMLKRPEAATIKLPGRCYVQVGYNEIFELVQSGYSGGVYEPSPSFIDPEDLVVKMIDNCGRKIRIAPVEKWKEKKGKAQLDAVVENIRDLSESMEIKPLSLWEDPLKEVITLEEIEGYLACGFNGSEWKSSSDWIKVIVGIYDDPENQMQLPLTIDLGGKGHVALYGMPGTGKTTFIQTLLYSLAHTYSPDDLNYYAFDLGGRTMNYLKDDPHCKNVVFSDEDDKVEQIFDDVMSELEYRKKIFGEINVGSIQAYKNSTGSKIPAILLVIDNYAVLRERFGQFEDCILSIANSGGNYGIHLVLTGSDKSAIYYRVVDYIKQVFTLQLNDKSSYMEILGQTNGLVPEPIKGRGLVKLHMPLEFQTALAINVEDEAERARRIREEYHRMSEAWKGKSTIGSSVMRQDGPMADEASEMSGQATKFNCSEFYNEGWKDFLPIGSNLKSKEIETFDLTKEGCLYIGGIRQSGKSDYMKQLMRIIRDHSNHEVLVVDSAGNYDAYIDLIDEAAFYNTSEKFDLLMEKLKDLFNERFLALKNYREETGGQDTEKEYEHMQQFQKIFIFIDGFSEFYSMISEKALERLEKMTSRLQNINIHFITAEDTQILPKYLGLQLFKNLIQTDTAILLGGRVNHQGIIPFDEMSTEEKGKTLSKGMGYVNRSGKHSSISTLL